MAVVSVRKKCIFFTRFKKLVVSGLNYVEN